MENYYILSLWLIMCSRTGYRLADSAKKHAQESPEYNSANMNYDIASAHGVRNISEKCVQVRNSPPNQQVCVAG